MNISLRQLRVFLAVVECQSFSRAGEKVSLTQPAVSRAIRELENELGLTLFDRTTREVLPTTEGRRLASELARTLAELETLLQESRNLGEGLRGKVRVASSPTLSASIMPGCLTMAQQRYPHIELTVQDQVQRLVLASVRSGEVDFGVIVDPQDDEDLLTLPILDDAFCLFCHQAHRFAGQDAVTWAELNGEKLLLLDYASGSRPLIDKALAQQGVECSVWQELGHSTTIFRMLETGFGISILPTLSLPLPVGSPLVMRPLHPVITRQIMLARRKNRSLSPSATEIWRLLASHASRFVAQGGPA